MLIQLVTSNERPYGITESSQINFIASFKLLLLFQNSKGVTKLAIPRIGCGLDGLVWNKVLDLIREIFVEDDVEITVYNYSATSN